MKTTLTKEEEEEKKKKKKKKKRGQERIKTIVLKFKLLGSPDGSEKMGWKGQGYYY